MVGNRNALREPTVAQRARSPDRKALPSEPGDRTLDLFAVVHLKWCPVDLRKESAAVKYFHILYNKHEETEHFY